jgi:hypothetical protein
LAYGFVEGLRFIPELDYHKGNSKSRKILVSKREWYGEGAQAIARATKFAVTAWVHTGLIGGLGAIAQPETH